MAIGLGVALGAAVVVGAVWLGSSSKQQQAEAERTACDRPVGEELLHVVDAAGRRIPQNDQAAMGRGDGSCSTIVSVPTSTEADAVLTQAMEQAGWTRQGPDRWTTPSGVEVSVHVWDDPGYLSADETVYELRGQLP